MENAGKNLSLYAILGTYTSSVVDVSIFIKFPIIFPNTWKLDSRVKTHSEISKRKYFWIFWI
jgi:hypothetical protein